MVNWVLLLLFTASVGAQDRTLSDSITVNVVEVPVYVERFGVPVTGLAREDFELFVNGASQAIESFDAQDEGRDAAATGAFAVSPPLHRRRLVLLLFDIAASSTPVLVRAQSHAARVVEEAAPGDTFSIATLGRDGVRFAVPFTKDRKAIQSSITTLAPSRVGDPFRLASLEIERVRSLVSGAEAGIGNFEDLWDKDGQGLAPGGLGTSSAASNAADANAVAMRLQEEEIQQQTRGMTDELGALAERLAPLPGIKHVVLLTERRRSDSGWMSGYLRASKMHERFKKAGVILDAVDIGFARAPNGERMPDLGPAPFLYTLALETGGAVTSSLQALRERNRSVYVLGFQPRGIQRKTNSIEVRVKGQPLLTDVRYRRSYSLDATIPDQPDGLLLADALMNDIPQDGVSVKLRAGSVRGATSLVASVPGVELLARPAGEPVVLDVYFYVFDAQGSAVAWSQSRVAIDLEKGRDFLLENEFTVRQEFRLAPGQYVGKALIRVVGTELTGFRRAEFSLPGAE